MATSHGCSFIIVVDFFSSAQTTANPALLTVIAIPIAIAVPISIAIVIKIVIAIAFEITIKLQ